ncbi:hypothetical protein RD792_013088 [Penstemon davidsonii]|uniref:Peptidase C1A papain C-terminal domain-containing protein n=1 Tax=Penstemon davidsonii TaxID=160366 RepID=A0ABR0CSF6_9LAMI|nr:hypothetical protein RD792_013088 [Penstemon davidsonii]
MSDNFDWWEKWVILPIRQQGGCHSCWAFGSSISSVESLNCIQNGKLIGLFEQHLIDCTVGTRGCKGGAIAASFRHIIEGLGTGKIYPYSAIVTQVLSESGVLSSGIRLVLCSADTQMGDDFDWREKGVILSIRQQGGCHSCWAFGSISTVESLNCIQNGKLIGLSEQHLIDCTVGTRGCKGGAIAASFRHIIEGLDTGKIYPYSGKDGQCDVTDLTCSSVVRHLASKRPLRSFPSFANSAKSA